MEVCLKINKGKEACELSQMLQALKSRRTCALPVKSARALMPAGVTSYYAAQCEDASGSVNALLVEAFKDKLQD